MERLVVYTAATIASVLGWRLGSGLGLFGGLMVSSILSAAALYGARRLWRHHFG